MVVVVLGVPEEWPHWFRLYESNCLLYAEPEDFRPGAYATDILEDRIRRSADVGNKFVWMGRDINMRKLLAKIRGFKSKDVWILGAGAKVLADLLAEKGFATQVLD